MEEKQSRAAARLKILLIKSLEISSTLRFSTNNLPPTVPINIEYSKFYPVPIGILSYKTMKYV